MNVLPPSSGCKPWWQHFLTNCWCLPNYTASHSKRHDPGFSYLKRSFIYFTGKRKFFRPFRGLCVVCTTPKYVL